MACAPSLQPLFGYRSASYRHGHVRQAFRVLWIDQLDVARREVIWREQAKSGKSLLQGEDSRRGTTTRRTEDTIRALSFRAVCAMGAVMAGQPIDRSNGQSFSLELRDLIYVSPPS